MKIKIYHHNKILAPAFGEKPDELPDNLLFDGSHHRLVWKGSLTDLDLAAGETDERLLETLFSLSGEKRLPNFLIERYRPLSYGGRGH